MKRILEPELMLDPEQVLAYSNADFTSSNRAFVKAITSLDPDFSGTILDIGCGPGDVTLMLAEALPQAQLLGIDGSATMLAEARRKSLKHLARDRVKFEKVFLPAPKFKPAAFDMVVSKDFLHHLPQPTVLWQEIARLKKPKNPAYIMDLRRPNSQDQAKILVQEHASDAPKILQEDFFNSLLAAFTYKELSEQLEDTVFKYSIDKIGDRHLFISLH